ncbi:MAG: peptidoglycan-binding protein [Clostridia bacterium]|nr:peptidoglycan-binding protein [Clostridia bacterium]
MTNPKRLLSLLLALLMLMYIPAAAMASSTGNIWPEGGIFVPVNPPNGPGSNGGSSGDSGHQHDYKWTTIHQATCTETGSQSGTCRVCGDTTTRTIGKARHDYEWTVVVQVTCKTDGEERGVCRNCGYTRTNTIKKGPHNFGEWVVTREPSDGAPGERARTCQTCGKTETETFYGADTLYPGIENREEAVMQLQQALTDAGYLKSKIDGDYGKVTAAAVRKFQQDNELNADGIAWPSMQGLLLLNKARPSDDAIGAGAESAIVSVRFERITTLPASLSPGQSAKVEYLVTNDGTAVLRTSWFGIDCGSQGAQKDYGKLVGGDRYWFLPGDSFIFEQQINVSDQDVANGSVRRTLLVGGEVWVNKATGEMIDMNNQEKLNTPSTRKSEGGWSVSDGYEIPLVSTAPVHNVTIESRVVSTPSVNPAFYVPGEDIRYDVVLNNLSETDLLNVAVNSSLSASSVVTVDRIGAGESFICGPYSYQATFDDAVGPLVNNVQVSFHYEDTQTGETLTAAPVEVWIGLHDGTLDISKSITNVPANGSFFTIGETIDFSITVSNATDQEMRNVIVTDRLTSGSGSAETILFETPVWAKDASQTLSYSHTVTAADVALGSVTNSALIHAENNIGLVWESESDAVNAPVSAVHDVTFETRVVSTPGVMPGFYVPGEVIYYEAVIENKSDTALTNAAIDSSLLPGANVLSGDRIEAGETLVCGPYSYQATFDDAVGPLVNTSQFTFTYEDTQTSDARSSSAEVWIGLNDGSLEITKSIANAPANGSFFTEGETIEYAITYTNATNEAMFDVVVTDMLTSGSGYSETILSSLPSWTKGASSTTGFSHTVTAADVALGSVTNSALIHAVNNIGLHWETESEAVTALTGIAADSAAPTASSSPAAADTTPAVGNLPLYLTVVGTPVDGLVGRTSYSTSAALYKAQLSGESETGMMLSADSAAENGAQIIYIADMNGEGLYAGINGLFDYSMDLTETPVLFGPIGDRDTYRITALMRTRVSDEALHLSNLSDLSDAALFSIYQTALTMSAARTEGALPAYGEDLLTLVVWDQAHAGQCLVIVANHE